MLITEKLPWWIAYLNIAECSEIANSRKRASWIAMNLRKKEESQFSPKMRP